MNIEFMNVHSQSKTVSLWFIALLVSFLITQQVYAANEQKWVQVPQENYAEVLDMIALRSMSNYQEISSWQGRMNILETKHYYGPNAAKMTNADTSSLARNSQHISEEIKNTVEFAVDLLNDKLYSKKENPRAKLRAMDLDQNVPARRNERHVSVRAILTPELYMWYMPDVNFASKLHSVRPGKMVFIEQPKERKFSLSGDIRDPRIFFESSGEDDKKLWETLLLIRSNIEERINTRVAGYLHIEISSLDTEDGTKYRILTTWKGGENYVIKYIRCLLEVDEAVGFNAIKTEMTNPDGVKTNSREYTYEKIGEIYLPKTVRKELWNSKGEPTFTSEITIETININKPLPEDTFTIKKLGLEEDTIVSDKIKKTEFRFSKGNLVSIEDANETN